MSYAESLGQFAVNLSSPSLYVPAPKPATSSSVEAWRVPIIDAARRYLIAVAEARAKMPEWRDKEFVYRTATDLFNAVGRETQAQLRIRAAVWAPILATSMPAARYNAVAQRDAVLQGQAALKALLLPPAAAPAPTYIPVIQTTAVTKVPVTTVPLAPTPTPATDVQCTDGYFRDASGLCQPGAASPGPVATPDVSNQLDITSAAPLPWTTESFAPLVTPLAPAPTATYAAPSSGPLGVSLKWWALGAAGVATAGFLIASSRKVTPNRRRRRGGV